MLILTTFLLYIQADAKNNWDESEQDLGGHGGRLQWVGVFSVNA